MSKYALIKNGVCANVIEADEAFVEKIRSEYDAVIFAEGTLAEVGATWDGTAFTRKPAPGTVPSIDPLAGLNAKIDKLALDVAAIKATVTPK